MRHRRIRLWVGILLVGMAGAAFVRLRSLYVVPVVMYHHVREARGRADSVDPETFRWQMGYLRRKGYRILTLDEYLTAKREGRRPRHSVLITFDDGNEDNHTEAFPVLQEFGYPAVFFISPRQIGQEGYMRWSEVAAMEAAGMAFGSHGMSQAYLPERTFSERWKEIDGSKRILEERLGRPVEAFAYPVGGFNEQIKKELRAAGYAAAFTTNRGHDRFNRDLYELNRIRLSERDNTDAVLWAKLSGYYNLFRRLKDPY